MACMKCGHSKKQKQHKTTGKFHDITIDCNCSCHKKNQFRFVNIPAVFTIPVPFAMREPIKIAIASSTIHPDGSIPKGYAMMMPITTENSEKDTERVIVCLKERP